MHEVLLSDGKAPQLKACRRPLDVSQHGKSWPVKFLIGSFSFSTAEVDRQTDGQTNVDSKVGLLGKLYVSSSRPAADSAASVQLPELHIKPGSTSKPLFHNPLEIGFSNSAKRTRLVVQGPGILLVVNG